MVVQIKGDDDDGADEDDHHCNAEHDYDDGDEKDGFMENIP